MSCYDIGYAEPKGINGLLNFLPVVLNLSYGVPVTVALLIDKIQWTICTF
jgi:NADH/NAD ratio-sensing transcriptional regulator Rex